MQRRVLWLLLQGSPVTTVQTEATSTASDLWLFPSLPVCRRSIFSDTRQVSPAEISMEMHMEAVSA